jgi:hypothetical protein
MEEQVKVLNIDQFKLVSNFSRFRSNYGGSCIFVRKDLHTKEVDYLNVGWPYVPFWTGQYLSFAMSRPSCRFSKNATFIPFFYKNFKISLNIGQW